MTSEDSSIVVRVLAADDVERIERLEPPEQGFVRAMWDLQQRAQSTLLVAWCDDHPIGSAELSWGNPVKLRNLNVDLSMRSRGVGTALIRAAEAKVGAGRDLTIGVGVDNQRAMALYERLGFRRTGALATTTYAYVDKHGDRRTATETDETLTKRLQ